MRSLEASASSIVIDGGNGSYSTSIRASAACAVSSSSAATAATGSPTKRAFSTQSACSSWLTGRIPNGTSSSLPTSVASTPGCAAALATSMRRMRAWGCGERSSRACAMRGSARSSANSVWPVTFAAASTRTSGRPTTPSLGFGVSATHDLGLRRQLLRSDPRLAPHPRRGQQHGLEDLEVAGAAAQVGGERLAHLAVARARVLRQQRLRGQQEARRVVAALRRAQLGEGLLQLVQLRAGGEPLDGRDAAALALDRQRHAREHGLPRSEEHTSELQSLRHLVCRLLLEKKNTTK